MDTIRALVSLGFDRADAEQTVRKARKDIKGEVSIEELVTKCLATL